MDAARLLRACEDTFRVIGRQFQRFRTAFDATPPDPLYAFSAAVVDAIRPLAHEQHTQAVAQALIDAKIKAHDKLPGKTREPTKRRLDDTELESGTGTPAHSNRAG